MRISPRRALLPLMFAVALGLTRSTFASQIANHLRVAQLALDSPMTPPGLKALLVRNFDAYLAGAAGPDVFTNLVGQYDRVSHMPHYEKTGQLLRRMFEMAYAETDLKQREHYLAYALGWMTHYYLDIREHDLVKRYGGYYRIDDKRHVALEMFETAHVFHTPEYRATLPYVAKAAGLPIELVLGALSRTFPDGTVNQLVDHLGQLSKVRATGDAALLSARLAGASGDIQLAAYIMEQFTYIAIDEFRTQKHVGTVQELAMGSIPFDPEYQMLMMPLDLSITNWVIDPLVKPGDPRSIYADLSWRVYDDGLSVGYISDWYAVNRNAVRDITGSFQSVLGTLWRVPLSLPDYDFDAGRPEGNDAEAVAASQQFKRIEAVEITWEVVSPRGQSLVNGTEIISLADQHQGSETKYTRPRDGVKRIYISAEPALFDVQNQKLTLRAKLRMINNNRQLESGRYVSAFTFNAGAGLAAGFAGSKTIVEETDEWKSVIDMPGLTESTMPPRGRGGPPPPRPGGNAERVVGVWKSLCVHTVGGFKGQTFPATLTATASGDRLKMSWDEYHLEGTIQGSTYTFTMYRSGRLHGDGVFQFTDRTFSGTWKDVYGKAGTWTGTKQ